MKYIVVYDGVSNSEIYASESCDDMPNATWFCNSDENMCQAFSKFSDAKRELMKYYKEQLKSVRLSIRGLKAKRKADMVRE